MGKSNDILKNVWQLIQKIKTAKHYFKGTLVLWERNLEHKQEERLRNKSNKHKIFKTTDGASNTKPPKVF